MPGDAPVARWRLEVAVTGDGASGIDVSGPLVQGKRGERYLALHWGDVDADGVFTLFRGAKLAVADVAPATVRDALRPGQRLVGTLRLTDAKGGPRCASVHPPDIQWSVSGR